MRAKIKSRGSKNEPKKPVGNGTAAVGNISKMKYHGHPNFTTRQRNNISIVLPRERGEHLFVLDLIKYEGIVHDVFKVDTFFELESWPPIIIIVGPASLKREHYNRLKAHVEGGGGLMTVGLVEPTEDMMGTMVRYPVFPFPVGGQKNNTVGEGYLDMVDVSLASVLLDADWFPLHGFGCTPTIEDGCDVLARYITVHESEEEWVAISMHNVGSGVALSFNIDVASTVRHIQEGLYVDRDGIPPPDAMSPIDDGILKAEDGLVLDWTRDRRIVSKKEKVPAFMIPVADCWKRLLRACIERVADETGCPIKRIDYWPDGAKFVTLISHDSDGNNEKLAASFLKEINSHGIRTTWCLQEPGYSKKLCREIASAGHELAFHFDAISDAMKAGIENASMSMKKLFTTAEFERQLLSVKKYGGLDTLYSNKNHYTRWEGRNEFFEWCERAGIRVDQSKGPSKCGTQGFPFGTCHPWQALNDEGELIGCLEICFMSQDFSLQGPADTGIDLLEAVKRINGVMHVIFHPAHHDKPVVTGLMRAFINDARRLGGKFMTSREIGEWTFARKLVISRGEEKLKGGITLNRDTAKRKWI
ncbi:MAG: hypothetical protein ACTSUE_13705 [Promethearchaeota archaeon]